MFYLIILKHTLFFNIKVTNIERSAFLGHPVYCDIEMEKPYIMPIITSDNIVRGMLKTLFNIVEAPFKKIVGL